MGKATAGSTRGRATEGRRIDAMEELEMEKNRASPRRPRHARAFRATVAAAVLAGAAPAWAGRPFATEDAGVLERGDCEWESLAGRSRSRGSPTERSLSTQLGCGLGWDTQGAVAAGRGRAGDDRSQAWSLGFKTALPSIEGNSTEQAAAFALAYGAEVDRQGEQRSYRRSSAFVNLAATRPLGAGWTAHANLGWRRDHAERRDSTTWALALERAAGESFDLGVEAYGDDRGGRWLGAGLRWNLGKAWSLNASYAANAETPAVRLAVVGFKFAF